MSPPRALVSFIAVAAFAAFAGVGAGKGVPMAPAAPKERPSAGAPARIAPSLAARLGADGPLPVLVTLRSTVRGEEYAGRPRELIRELRRTAAAGQSALPGRAATQARRLWLANAVALRARPAEIRRLARDPAVASIEYDGRVRVFAPTDEPEAPAPPALFGRGGWGLAATGAPAVWRDYGLDGRGVRVGSIDSGVDADHPDLAGKVAAWRDFVDDRPEPYDDHGHGTHTIGTMVGGSAGGAPIGVAPGARVVVAKALDGDGGATLSTLLAAAQWITDPDGSPLTHDAPSVVNASWGAPSGTGGEALRRVIRRWRELGIVPVFSAGNAGPEGSVAAPAAYPETLAVGALGPRGHVAAFSSRGGLGESTTLKPDLAAPGHQIVSSAPGGAWESMSGTSMAAPHVAGAIALLRQADRAISVADLEATLRDTARDVADAGPDRRSGAGALDAGAAVAAVLGPRSPRPGLSLIAVPPTLTNREVLTFAVASGGAPLGVWLDGARVPGVGAGPLVRVPVREPGRHTIGLSALDSRGAALGAPRRFSVTIDREPPRLELASRQAGLLGIDYRAEAADEGGVLDRSLRTRLSDGGKRRGGPAGRHTFTGPGPYWVEAEVADRAGNVRRVRRALSWPSALVARRLAWNETLSTLRVPFGVARGQRRISGRYRTTPGLVRLLAANWEWTPFAALAHPSARPPDGAIGVWSDGRSRLVLSMARAGRLYFMEDCGGRLGRGVLTAPRTRSCRADGAH
jgi:subtilisin family serine protease